MALEHDQSTTSRLYFIGQFDLPHLHALMSELPPKPRRHWLRFGLRTTFLAIFAVGVLCAMYLVPAKRQEWATESLERIGVQICYDYQRQPPPSTSYSHRVQPPGWPFARRLIGKDFFQTATAVIFNNSPLTVDDLTPISALPQLRNIALHNCDLDDEHLQSLADLSVLNTIILSGNRITDAGLGHLSRLTELESLELSDNEIDGSGLEYLKGMTNLRLLGLHHNPVTDDGLVHVADFRNLQHLGLADSNVTDEGLKHLASLKNLRYLGLSRTYVTRAAVKELREEFPNCKIESSGLRQK